jgi:hypothetical protein
MTTSISHEKLQKILFPATMLYLTIPVMIFLQCWFRLPCALVTNGLIVVGMYKLFLTGPKAANPLEVPQSGAINIWHFLIAMAYNIGNFLRRLALPKSIKDWSLRMMQEKLVKIGAKVVSHARYVTFQMAEVLVSKSVS